MLNNLKKRLTQDWNLMRIIRAGLAVLVLVEAWKSAQIIFAVLGSVLLGQVLMNVGCCGSGGCEISHDQKEPKSDEAKLKDVTFKEIK